MKYRTAHTAIKITPVITPEVCFLRSFLMRSLYKTQNTKAITNTRGIQILKGLIIAKI